MELTSFQKVILNTETNAKVTIMGLSTVSSLIEKNETKVTWIGATENLFCTDRTLNVEDSPALERPHLSGVEAQLLLAW